MILHLSMVVQITSLLNHQEICVANSVVDLPESPHSLLMNVQLRLTLTNLSNQGVLLLLMQEL